MDLLLASTNPAKRDHLRALVARLPVRLVEPRPEWPDPPVAEGSGSFLENARRKARAWARATGLPSLASDGGLVIPALGARWQAVLTRRAAGEEATDAQRAQHLLALLREAAPADRRAYHREAAALSRADGSLVGSWQSRGETLFLAESFDSTGVPEGFWLPGLLLDRPRGRRLSQLSPSEQERAERHWSRLGPRLRAAVRQLLREEDADERAVLRLHDP